MRLLVLALVLHGPSGRYTQQVYILYTHTTQGVSTVETGSGVRIRGKIHAIKGLGK